MVRLRPTIKPLSVIFLSLWVQKKPIHLLGVSGCDLTKVLGVAELRDVGSVRQFGVVSSRSEIKLAKGNSSSVQASSICAGGCD
jgi:hypothetical protein